MDYFLISGLAFTWVVAIVGCWLGWQLLRQNGRMLLRLDALEQQLAELEMGEPSSSRPEEAHFNFGFGISSMSLLTSAATRT